MDTNKPHKLLKRHDSRFLYTMDELQTIIHDEEEKFMKNFKREERSCVQLWVKNVNINFITDTQIEQIKNEYIDNGWHDVKVERQTSERGGSCLYIFLSFGKVKTQEV